MIRKTVVISLLVILVLSSMAFAGYRIVDSINQKKTAEEAERIVAMKSHIAFRYSMQNEAFYGLGSYEYLPYLKEAEFRLQAHINYYTRNTGKTITLSDVEAFLANPENSDGTPRTWEDDETGIVKAFVDWCRGKRSDIDNYRGNLEGILNQYLRINPKCSYNKLADLTPEQITELDKKYADPDYELVLE